MLPGHAHCVLSRLRCNGHNLLLNSYLSRIDRIDNPLCSACGHPTQNTAHLNLSCPATNFTHVRFLATHFLYTTCDQGLGELPSFWGFMVFHQALIRRKGQVTTTTKTRKRGRHVDMEELAAITLQCFTGPGYAVHVFQPKKNSVLVQQLPYSSNLARRDFWLFS